jgi:hypothetical protein
MMRRLALRSLTVTALLLLAGHVSSDDKTDGKKADPQKKGEAPSKEAMMEAWLKVSTPGPEHKRLDVLAGSWTFVMKMWMEPGAAPTESKGTSECKWLLGGRYLAQEVTGQFMGMPFNGYSLMAYDNAQKKYISVWMDSFGTGISQAEGTADASGKVLTFHREEFDPFAGQKMKSRDVFRLSGKDKFEMEMYRIQPDGKEHKMMEIHYTRQASKEPAKTTRQR